MPAPSERLILDLMAADELHSWARRIDAESLANGRLRAELLRQHSGGHEGHKALWQLCAHEFTYPSDVLANAIEMLVADLLSQKVTSHEGCD